MNFTSALDRIRRWRRVGRWLAALLGGIALAGVVALLGGLADAWLVFESPARTVLVITALALLAIATLCLLVAASLVSRQHGAAVADRLLASPRRAATGTLSIPATAATPLAEFLSQRARESAAAELASLPPNRIIAWKPIVQATLAVLLTTSSIAVLTLSWPDAARVIGQRLLHPSADLPPWSPLRFAVEPEQPSAVYGGELALAVEVSGGALEFPVELLVRRTATNEVLRLPSFRESSVRFSRNLESLTEPVSVAFACGKARSPWQPVELLLQPKILAGKVTVTPPDYVGAEPVSTPLDSSELSAIEGACVVLELTSNRPLAPSSLIFTPATAPGVAAGPQEIPGELTASDSLSFRWTVTRTGKLSALLRDVRGTPAASPLELAFRALPDQAPVIDLASPPRLLLATASSTLRLAGRADDDHALAKVQLVRTLEGFRDRSRVVASALHQRAFEFSDLIDLPALGVVPGQVLEMFLEASDHNPSLLGQGASEISRVKIISEEDYAAHIRAKTTLEQFSARYRAIAQAFQQAQESLEAMDRAAAGNDPQAAEAARQKAIEAHRQAAALFEQLAADFPAFQLEPRLKDLAAKGAGNAKQNLSDLAAFDPKAPAADQRQAIRRMLDRLGTRQAERQQLQKDAAMVAEAGKLLEMAAKFQQIYSNQVSITKRLLGIAEEIHKGIDQNRRLLPSLAETQQRIRGSLDEFATELKQRAGDLQNPALAPLRDSALAFLDALATANPQSAMDGAARSARLGVANDAYAQAELARALLEKLMDANQENGDNPFANACKGQCLKFSVAPPDVNGTIRQLLEALMCQNPGMTPNPNQGGGGGLGLGGFGPTGNEQPGFAMLDVPVVGPQRIMFEPSSIGGSGNEHGQTTSRNPVATTAESESLKPAERPHQTEATPNPEAVPEPYREAVKRYFSND